MISTFVGTSGDRIPVRVAEVIGYGGVIGALLGWGIVLATGELGAAQFAAGIVLAGASAAVLLRRAGHGINDATWWGVVTGGLSLMLVALSVVFWALANLTS